MAEWLARADLAVLVLAGGLAAATLAFLLAADAVTSSGQTDDRILRALREPHDPADPIGPRWFEEAARDVTALGGAAVLTLLVGGVVGYLFIAKKHHAAILVLAATLGGAAISTLLKGYYARPRPDLVPHLSYATSASFPSGHAMLSAVVYLTLGALLARLHEGRWLKVYFVGVAILLTLLVGASRVYLGVHYPTDVVAGWAAGVAWAVVCWLVARRLQRRGVVEGTG
ncbi:MAG TPA: phosphatase PAP2 family protein [Gemmataceae bacterium]|nr:phosphatase PAP2 family protein [Gemmataceae bacterium]